MNKVFVIPEEEAIVVSCSAGGTCGVYMCGKPAKWSLLTKPCRSEEPMYSPTSMGHQCSKACRPDYDVDHPQLSCAKHKPELVVMDEKFVSEPFYWLDEVIVPKRWKRELEWTLKERPIKRVLVFDE